MTNWKCGSPACDRPLDWHARRAEHLLATEGPDAEREFEMDHPDSEAEEETFSAVEVIEAIATVTTLPVRLEHTGGGVATIYVGHAGPDDRYTLAIGPGSFADEPTFYGSDCYVGPDDDGEADAIAVKTLAELAAAVKTTLLALDPRFAETVPGGAK